MPLYLAPAFDVWMKDGTEFEQVQPQNSDLTQYDKARRVRGWGTAAEDGGTWVTFIVWRRLKTDKQIGMSFEEFEGGECVSIVEHKGDPTEVDPTNGVPAPG